MKRSIRLKFTALFIGLLAAVLLAIWAVNSFFLEQYYIKEKVKILQNAYEQLNSMPWSRRLREAALRISFRAFILQTASRQR